MRLGGLLGQCRSMALGSFLWSLISKVINSHFPGVFSLLELLVVFVDLSDALLVNRQPFSVFLWVGVGLVVLGLEF